MDVERCASWVAAHLPPNADATSWIPSAADLQDDGVISEAVQVDSRMSWWNDKRVERRFRKLLDARAVE